MQKKVEWSKWQRHLCFKSQEMWVRILLWPKINDTCLQFNTIKIIIAFLSIYKRINIYHLYRIGICNRLKWQIFFSCWKTFPPEVSVFLVPHLPLVHIHDQWRHAAKSSTVGPLRLGTSLRWAPLYIGHFGRSWIFSLSFFVFKNVVWCSRQNSSQFRQKIQESCII